MPETPSPKCPKCDKSTEKGFLVGASLVIHSPETVQRWIAGEPSVVLIGRNPAPITTWRCVGCGFLESYAK